MKNVKSALQPLTPMSLSEEFKLFLQKNPSAIGMYPDAPEELQLICVKSDSATLKLIENPSPRVILETFRAEVDLVSSMLSFTEEKKLSLQTGCTIKTTAILNPSRDAALLILTEFGAYFKRLNQVQVELDNAFAASPMPLLDDLEMQVAALSNLSGLWLMSEEPALFNKPALTEQYSTLMTVANSWIAVGFYSADATAIEDSLRAAKVRQPLVHDNVDLPNNFKW